MFGTDWIQVTTVMYALFHQSEDPVRMSGNMYPEFGRHSAFPKRNLLWTRLGVWCQGLRTGLTSLFRQARSPRLSRKQEDFELPADHAGQANPLISGKATLFPESFPPRSQAEPRRRDLRRAVRPRDAQPLRTHLLRAKIVASGSTAGRQAAFEWPESCARVAEAPAAYVLANRDFDRKGGAISSGESR